MDVQISIKKPSESLKYATDCSPRFVLGFSTIVAPALNFGFIFKLICIQDTDKVHGWLQRQLDYGVSAGTKAKQPNLGLKIYNNGDRNYSSGSKNDKRA